MTAIVGVTQDASMQMLQMKLDCAIVKVNLVRLNLIKCSEPPSPYVLCGSRRAVMPPLFIEAMVSLQQFEAYALANFAANPPWEIPKLVTQFNECEARECVKHDVSIETINAIFEILVQLRNKMVL